MHKIQTIPPLEKKDVKIVSLKNNKINISSFELENEIVFNYFQKLPFNNYNKQLEIKNKISEL